MAANEVIDVEEVPPEQPAENRTTAGLATIDHTPAALMSPVASLEQTVAAFLAYQELREALLDRSDFQEAERGKEFVKKSGWRKLAVGAMNVSDELVSRDYLRDDYGRVMNAEVTVRVTAPNGRFGEGLGICDYRERCCPRAFSEQCRKNHKHCDDTCTGFSHFSKPAHDIPSTAHTRAKNRAASDLFGFGEVSAEEVSGGQHDDDGRNDPAPGEEVRKIMAAFNSIKDEGQRRGAKLAFARAFGRPNELTAGQLDAARTFVANAGGTFSDAAPQDQPAPQHAAEGDSQGAPDSPGPDASEGDPARQSHTPAGPPTSPAPDGPTAPSGPANGSAARRSLADAPPDQPRASTAHQRRSIGMAIADLAKKELLPATMKPEIVGILTGGRTATTTEMTHDEAVKMIAVLRYIETGDLGMFEDPQQEGGMTIGDCTPRGATFLRTALNAS